VDIILCLNIFSESATQCIEIVKYLKNESMNEVADLYVAGVEAGNENYFQSSRDMLGMLDFEDYWSFVNGGESYGIWWNLFSEHVFSDDMLADHDYLSAFKLDAAVACKIGIPATNINEEGYALKDNGEVSESGETSWNALLRSHYEDRIYYPDGPYSFDAVVLHPYYTAKDNYQDIALLFEDNYGCPLFDYTTFDSDLEPAFKGILGITSPEPLFGNFRDFIRTRYLESYDYQNAILDFGLTVSYKKDLWTTEWNMLDEFTPVPGELLMKERMDIYHNSFAGAFLLQEWWLWNLRLNYMRNFRNNFYTYAHFHNYHGTEYQNTLVLDADCADMKRYGLDPEEYTGDRLYLRRTNYFVMQHLRPVAAQRLKYIRNNQYIHNLNPNLQTTTFITQSKDTVYVYFSNMRQEDQHFIVNGADMTPLFPNHPIYGAPVGVLLGNAFIKCIDAQQPYSTSGKSTVYDLNTCYNCHGLPLYWHDFEIMAENTDVVRAYWNTPSCFTTPGENETCVSVPAYSVGFFKIPVEPEYAPPKQANAVFQQQINLFPNPASATISYTYTYGSVPATGYISNICGNRVMQFDPEAGGSLNIAFLPAGVYYLTLAGASGTITKAFIKQ